jgi:hypothetical protein
MNCFVSQCTRHVEGFVTRVGLHGRAGGCELVNLKSKTKDACTEDRGRGSCQPPCRTVRSTDTSELLSALTCRDARSRVHRHRSGSPLRRHLTRRLIVEPTLHVALSRCTGEPGLDRVRRLTRAVAAAAFLAVVVDRTHTRRLAARRRMSASSAHAKAGGQAGAHRRVL